MNNKDNNDNEFDKQLSRTISQCQHHLKEIIKTKPVVYWAEKLGVSKSLISARWKKDHFPNIPNIINLLILSGFSANWLLLGIGPKYISHVHDPDQSAADELRRRQMAVDFFVMENKLSEANNKLKELKHYMGVHQGAEWIKAAMEDDIFSKTATEIKVATGKSVFKQFILPIMTLLQSISHIGFKLFEAIADSEDSGEKIEAVINHIRTNMEKNQFSLQSSLADLDMLLEEMGINERFSSQPTK